MTPIIDYLEEQKFKKHIKRDTQLAKELKISRASISRIMNGKDVPSEETCLKIATFFNDEPEKILLLAQASKAKEQARPHWNNIIKKMANCACPSLILFGIRYIM